MAGELTIDADGAVVDANGGTIVAAQSYRWCTIVRGDDWIVRMPDSEGTTKGLVEVPRRPELLFSLLADTVATEIAVASALHGSSDDEAMIRRLKAEMHLAELDQRNPLDLSGGEMAKLAICIALLSNPRVLVLDDVLEPVDAAMRPEIVRTLRGRDAAIVEVSASPPKEWGAQDVIVFAAGDTCQVCMSHDVPNRLDELQPHYPPRELPTRAKAVVLTVQDLTHTYPGSFRLQPVSLEVNQGEVVRIAGRNGSGKSTLLKALAQLVMPDGGTVSMSTKEQPMTLRYPQRRHMKGLAKTLLYQFQDPANQLYCATVRDELLETAVRSGSTTPRAVEAVAEELGLLSLLRSSPWDLSEGQRRMLTLGSILCANPPLLLADEPTAQLDLKQRIQVALAIGRYVREGGTCMFITHDDAFSTAMATRTVFMPGEGPAAAGLLPLEAATEVG